jgi:hypothetical protein
MTCLVRLSLSYWTRSSTEMKGGRPVTQPCPSASESRGGAASPQGDSSHSDGEIQSDQRIHSEAGVYKHCLKCQIRQAWICQECMRAVALMQFDAIARHPEAGTDCVPCQAGPASYCADCWTTEVADYRSGLARAGNLTRRAPQ